MMLAHIGGFPVEEVMGATAFGGWVGLCLVWYRARGLVGRRRSG